MAEKTKNLSRSTSILSSTSAAQAPETPTVAIANLLLDIAEKYNGETFVVELDSVDGISASAIKEFITTLLPFIHKIVRCVHTISNIILFLVNNWRDIVDMAKALYASKNLDEAYAIAQKIMPMSIVDLNTAPTTTEFVERLGTKLTKVEEFRNSYRATHKRDMLAYPESKKDMLDQIIKDLKKMGYYDMGDEVDGIVYAAGPPLSYSEMLMFHHTSFYEMAERANQTTDDLTASWVADCMLNYPDAYAERIEVIKKFRTLMDEFKNICEVVAASEEKGQKPVDVSVAMSDTKILIKVGEDVIGCTAENVIHTFPEGDFEVVVGGDELAAEKKED